MSDKTGIQWSEATWNFTTGCDQVSPGCDQCYALTLAGRLKLMGSPKYQTDGNPETSGPGFGIAVHPDVLDLPLSWVKPRRIFVNSMSDLFHDGVPDDIIAKAFAVMAACTQHTFQILTKRHGRMRSLLNREVFRQLVMGVGNDRGLRARIPAHLDGGGLAQINWPLTNVHLGVSAEDQPRADLRIPALLDTPAAVRWVSLEPLLGPVDLCNLHAHNGALIDCLAGDVKNADGEVYAACPSALDWVVVGGESGTGNTTRPLQVAWIRTLVRQCRTTNVPVFVKQLGTDWAARTYTGPGGTTVRANRDHKAANMRWWPADLRVREYPHG